ncbi:MAG: serine hydrolase [Pigmentiphaga sp.]|nr:serine hydrolase [Pigmentiphaga sp.]
MKLALTTLNPSGASGLRSSLASAAIALAAMAACAPAVSQTPLPASEVEALLPQIESTIQAAMTAWEVPGLAVGIVADDQLVYAKGFGIREHGSNKAVDAETLFQIGSATKAFLGATEAILVDRGKLAWTDKVVDYYPEFRLADPWVTQQFEIGDLLAQRSGLPPWTLTSMMLYDYPRTDIIAALQFVAPISSFRSDFGYQNAFHLVAEKVIERAADAESWEAFLQSELLDPLGMSASSYTADAMRQAANRATGHRREAQAIIIDPWAPFPYNAGGAGGLNSSVKDMSRWLRFQINQGEIDGKRILSPRALRDTHQPRIALSGFMRDLLQTSEQDDVAYATGWLVHNTPQGRIIEHGGATTGFTSQVSFDPDRRVGVVVLTNLSVDFGNGAALPIGKSILDLLQGRPPVDHAGEALAALYKNRAAQEASLRPPANPQPPRPLEDYAGTYTSSVLGPVTIGLEEGKLAFTVGPRDARVALEPWSGDIFIAKVELPALGPHPYVETKKLRFFVDMQDNIAGFDWSDDSDGSGQPPFSRQAQGRDAG